MPTSAIAPAGADCSQLLDARGLNCPLPILRARKLLSAMESGATLRIVATDPGAVNDFASFCNQTGHTLIAATAAEGAFEFLIRKT